VIVDERRNLLFADCLSCMWSFPIPEKLASSIFVTPNYGCISPFKLNIYIKTVNRASRSLMCNCMYIMGEKRG